MSDDQAAAKTRWALAFMPGLEQILARRDMAALDLQRPKPKIPEADAAQDGRTIRALDLEPPMARITWADPGPVQYVAGGFTLSGRELNAKVVPGDCELEYTPPAGTRLDAGTYTLAARPRDPARHGAVEAKVTFIVEPAEAYITLNPVPADYAPGLVLAAGHFQASVQPAGLLLELQPHPGQLLDAGSHPLTASLAKDPANANYVCRTPPREDLVVRRAKARLQLAPPSAAVRYVEGGYLLRRTDFVVTCDPPDLDLVCTPSPGTAADVGDVTLGVALATTGRTANYECADPPPVTLTVGKGLAIVSLTRPADIEWIPGGFILTKAQFGAVVQPVGLQLTYNPDIGTRLPSGPQTLSISLEHDRWVLDTAPPPIALQVNPARAAITWPKPPTPVTFQPGGFVLTAKELCAKVIPASVKLAFEIGGSTVAPGDKLQAGTHSVVASLAADPANEHYVAASAPAALVVNKLAFVITVPKTATKVDATNGSYALAFNNLGIVTKPKVEPALLAIDPALGSALEPGNTLHSITIGALDPGNYQADPQTATIRVTAAKVTKKGPVVGKPAMRAINGIEYPAGASRDTIMSMTKDGRIKKQLGNRLDELAKFELRAEDHGSDLKPGVPYHCKFLGMTCGMLFTFREEADKSVTPILLDVAFARESGNKYAGNYVKNWW